MNWYDDRLALAELIDYLDEQGVIQTALDASYVVEKPWKYQMERRAMLAAREQEDAA